MELLDTVKLGTMGFKPEDIKRIKSSGIETNQIIELAKNGYSAKDVDELIALTQENAGGVQPGNNEEHEPEPQGIDGANDKIDYKEELAKRDQELKDLKDKIEKIREDNIHKDYGANGPTDPRQAVREALLHLY